MQAGPSERLRPTIEANKTVVLVIVMSETMSSHGSDWAGTGRFNAMTCDCECPAWQFSERKAICELRKESPPPSH